MSISKPSYNRYCKGMREIMTDHTGIQSINLFKLFDSSDQPGLIDPHIISLIPIYFSAVTSPWNWLANSCQGKEPQLLILERWDHLRERNVKVRSVWSPAPDSLTGKATDYRFRGPEFKVRFPVWSVIISPILLQYQLISPLL